MQVCTSLQADNHASTPPLSFLQAGCLSCHPTNSVKALNAKTHSYYFKFFWWYVIFGFLSAENPTTSCITSSLNQQNTGLLQGSGSTRNILEWRVLTRTKHYCAFIQYMLNHYQNSIVSISANKLNKLLKPIWATYAVLVSDLCCFGFKYGIF